uniref:DUF4220 domain-containing protein n=1 Tax=Oryza brachyantha TaxID=4533 RepID=J3N2L2_ORYBR
MLWWATMLMLVVGVVKYGERVWALKCAGSSLSGKNYRWFGSAKLGLTVYNMDHYTAYPIREYRDTEALLLMAHRLLDLPKSFLKGPLPKVVGHELFLQLSGKDIYKVVEIELSLMHDVFYTKSEVMHAWYGLCIRVFLPLVVAVAFFLFCQHHRHKQQWEGYNRVDIVVTFILFVGALILEMVSSLRAMLSSWTLAFLVEPAKPPKNLPSIKKLLSRVILPLRRLVHAADWRRKYYWTGSMGQLNLVELCVHGRASQRSKIAKWLGLEDQWNVLACSRFIHVPRGVKNLLYEGSWRARCQVDTSYPRVPLTLKLGEELLSKCLDDDNDSECSNSDSAPVPTIEEHILTWHISTEIYLDWWKEEQAKPKDQTRVQPVDEENANGGDKEENANGNDEEENTNADDEEENELAEAVRMLSNYMFFLLASRPYMLPPPINRVMYVELCNDIIYTDQRAWPSGSTEALMSYLRGRGPKSFNQRIKRGHQLGTGLIKMEEQRKQEESMLRQIGRVWAEMVCYAGHKCGADHHAKSLSNGGELITVAALLVEHALKESAPGPREEYPLRKLSYDHVPDTN